MRNQHNWTERTDAGEKREIRATKFGGNWKIQSKLAKEEYWNTHDNPDLHDVRQLHDVLFRKYQRKRAAWHEVEFAAEWVKRLGGELEES